jgi:GNAT superfamily N-acetyltransferase
MAPKCRRSDHNHTHTYTCGCGGDHSTLRRRGQGLPGMKIAAAQAGDFTSFVSLAAEVEAWFGPMVREPGFHDAVRKNISRGSALIAFEGKLALGGLLFSFTQTDVYSIRWLVVTAHRRSQGIGEALLARAVRDWVRPPAILKVVTFGPDHPGARSRRFYRRLGFEPAQPEAPGPDGGTRERFELQLARLPDWAT